MRDLPKRFRMTVAVDRLRLAVPERHPTLSRITHDHRIMGQIQQLRSQLQLLLGSLRSVTSRADTTRFSPIETTIVSTTRVATGCRPTPARVDVIGPGRLAGHGHPAVDRESLAARIVGKQLPDSVPEQLLAVEPDQLAVGVVDVLIAKIDDLAAITTDR